MENQLLVSFSQLCSYKNPSKYIKEIFAILAHYSDKFLAERTFHYLSKLAHTHFLSKKYFSKSFPKDTQRHIYMRFLSVKFQNPAYSRKVLGISVSFNLLSEYEKFDYKHIAQILKRMIPGIHILDDSFYYYCFQKQKRLFCYFEIEKIRGKNLSFQDCLKLKKSLPQEIKDGIEFLSPNLFIPKNDEEIFRNILRLSKEMDSPKDIPHAMISFQEQDSKNVKFNVILLRILKKQDPPIKDVLSNFPNKIQFQIERRDLLKTGYIKEASVFSLELKNSLFSRKNHSVDLLKTRQYICMILKDVIGEFRDYNGGLLSKQTKQFDLIKKELIKHIRDVSAFEEFFYSLNPSNIQLLISFEIALEFCKTFYKIKNESLKSSYLQYSYSSNDVFFIIVKTDSFLYDSIFSDLPPNQLLAKTSKTIDEEKYHCLIQMNPPDLSLLEHVREKLLTLEKQTNLQTKQELRIAFEFSPPSFHPHLSTDIRSLTLGKALFEGLTRINLDGTIDFALAKNFKVSLCKKIYTFTLHSSKWSNGEDLTSYHFEQSWKKAIALKSNCIRVKNFFLIKNAKKVNQGIVSLDELGIHTPSKQELVVELEYPAPYFLQLLADPIYSPLYDTETSEEPSVFNGPFLPAPHKTDKYIELVSNSFYWDIKSVKLQKVIICLIQDSSKVYEMYKKEKLDCIGGPFHSLPKKILKKSKTIQSYEPYFPFWLFCNTKSPKLKSAKIRKALSHSIDREKLIRKVLPFQKPSYSIIPEKLSLLTSADYCLKNPMEKALSLFEEGLQEIDIKRHNFELNLSHSDISEHKELSFFLKNTWENAFNIQINLIEYSWNSYWNAVFNQEYEIAGFFSYATYEEFIRFMDFFECTCNNYITWENKDYQKYFRLAKQSTDKTEMRLLLKKAEMILNNEMPVIPIYNHIPLYLKSKSINGFNLSKFSYIDFKWVHFNNE